MLLKAWLAGRFARLAGTRGAILCFHGLDAGGEPSPSSMHIPIERLETILDSVRRLGSLVPLEEVVSRHLAGRSTRGLVALTADDAYASWLPAIPLLTQYRAPFTFFAVGQAIEAGDQFWWDRVEESCPRTPDDRWQRFEAESGVPEAYRSGHPASAGRTRAIRQWVLAEHAGRCPASLEQALDRLEAEVGHRSPQRSMSAAELAEFLDRTGSTVGVHTLTHAALPFLDDEAALTEVAQGHEVLRRRFGKVLPYLAIPFGLFDERTLRLSARAGMTVSFNLEGQPLDQPFSQALGVPRICIVREQPPGLLDLKVSVLGQAVRRLRGGTGMSYPVLPSATT